MTLFILITMNIINYIHDQFYEVPYQVFLGYNQKLTIESVPINVSNKIWDWL